MSGYFHTDDGVRWYSKCEKNFYVLLKDENGIAQNFQHEVGLCWLSKESARCVTKGIKKNTVYHYDYDSTNNLCLNPKEMSYTLSASWTRFFSFLKFLKCW